MVRYHNTGTQKFDDLESESLNTGDASTGEQPVRDVRTYGAVGDDATDDTAAIQSALDDGGIIWIPHSHTFRADGLTQSVDGTRLMGNGTIRRRESDTGTDWVLSVSANGGVVEDITVDGANYDGGGRGEGIRTTGDDVSIRGTTVKNTPTGVGSANTYIVRGGSARLEDVTSIGAGYGAFRLDSDTEIIGFDATDWAVKGIVCNDSAERISISNGRIHTTEPQPGSIAQGAVLFDPANNGPIEQVTVRDVTVTGDISGNVSKVEGDVDSVVYSGCRFAAALGGQVVVVTTSGIQVSIKDSHLLMDGGRIKTTQSTGTVVVDGCTLDGSGGRCLQQEGDVVRINDSTFTNFSEAIRIDDSTDSELWIDGCTFNSGDFVEARANDNGYYHITRETLRDGISLFNESAWDTYSLTTKDQQ